MTIPTTAQFNIGQVLIEVGLSQSNISASNASLRDLADDTSGDYAASAWRGKSAAPPLTVAMSDNAQFFNSSGTKTMFMTAIPSGGTPPYSFLFSESGQLNLQSQTGDTCVLSYSVPSSGSDFVTSTVTVTVTDSRAKTATTNALATLSYNISGGGGPDPIPE
jgi:hypothetical protein